MTKKQISRREAMKVLGAAIGGSALATLPPVWKEPALITGNLPAHAQTSCETIFLTTSINSINILSFGTDGSVTPPNSTINYQLMVIGSGTIGGQKNLAGSFLTDGSGNGDSGALGIPENFIDGDQIQLSFSWDGGSYCAIFTISDILPAPLIENNNRLGISLQNSK